MIKVRLDIFLPGDKPFNTLDEKKVLYGEIEATFYDSLNKPSQIGSGPATLKERQITWLDPENYQIHMLNNTSPGVTCTIQCYR